MDKPSRYLGNNIIIKNRANFSFNFVSKQGVLTEIKVLDVPKAIQESDIPVKFIKVNRNFYAETIQQIIRK